ncbi:MAG TPA: hypothetical protein VM328_13130 [Fimbriimonadaceae bacterium]|nr:hypothetical protein [Fimbriimonadaceae bacterium]
MGPTIYAVFETVEDAERAAGALLDHGCRAEDISLIANEGYYQDRPVADYDRAAVTTSTHSSVTGDPAYADADNLRDQPLRGDIGDLPVDADVEAGEIADTHVRMGGAVHASRLGDTAYPAERPFAPDPTSGIHVNTMSQDEALQHSDDPPHVKTMEDPAHPETGGIIARGVDRTDVDNSDRYEPGAGLTATTGRDAAIGAAKGAGVGLGIGALAALISVFIPGVGLVAGGGALATALAGAAGTTAAGAAAGGVLGYLKDQGVPDDVLVRYRDSIQGGGALLAVQPTVDKSRAEIEAVLGKYNALNIDLYGEDRAA